MLQGIYFLTLPLVCLCSKVLDEFSQKAVIVSDYCPSISGCQDATHIMCLYYDPKNVISPECMHAVSLSITTEYVQLIVDICNRIRSKIANGLGKGEGDTELPRGYGILKLSWDPELATLAQVWVNQCRLKNDLCRATRRFPNPGQIIGMSRYTVDKWMPISLSESNLFNSTTLTPDKVRQGIIKILKAWYQTKDEVNSNTIVYMDVKSNLWETERFPRGRGFRVRGTNHTIISRGHSKNNQFVQIVSGRTTHVGCGLIGYRQYVYNNNNAALNYNVFQIVCNFSYRPHVGEAVYTTKPPTEPGYTLRCGCPLGYDEDEDCLCYETDRVMPLNCKETGRCKASVVVLPIFTVEDAPLNILKHNNNSKNIVTPPDSRHESLKSIPFIDYTRSNKNDLQIIKQDSVYKTRRISTDVRNRYFGEKSKHTNKSKTKPPRRNIHKQSIFAKAAVFELPSSKIKQVVQNAAYKQDVKPRKDFSKVQKLVSKYLETRRNGQPFHKIDVTHILSDIKSFTIAPYSIPNKVNNKVYNLTDIPKDKFTYVDSHSTRTPRPKDEMKSFYEENDQIFMNLLDKLEEEVNNIDFNTKEKIFFDEKIRKIYGTLVKKSVVTEHSLVNGNISTNKVIIDNNNIQNDVNRRNYWLDPNKLNEYTYPNKRNEYTYPNKPNEYTYPNKRNEYTYPNIHNEYTYPNLEDRPTHDKSITKYNDKMDRDVRNNKHGKKYDISFRSETLDNENLGERKLRNMHPRQKSHINSMSKGSSRRENYYLKSGLDEYNSLESERRRHYFNKLDKLQRKVSMIKKHERNNFINEDLHLRPVRPSKHGSVRRSRPEEMDLYMPNRARFVHGF